MIHRNKFSLLLGGGLCCAFSLVRADVVPGGFPADRYASLWEHSPFTTASVQQEAAPPGFADKLTLVGLAKVGDEDIVTLLNKESQERINLSTNKSPQGLKIVSVELNADPMKACVTIQKGNETAKVRFDKSTSGGGQMASVANPVFNNAGVVQSAPNNPQPRVPRPVTVPVSERVVRIISPAPPDGSIPLPPRPGSR
jgi:hypothetical protein